MVIDESLGRDSLYAESELRRNVLDWVRRKLMSLRNTRRELRRSLSPINGRVLRPSEAFHKFLKRIPFQVLWAMNTRFSLLSKVRSQSWNVSISGLDSKITPLHA